MANTTVARYALCGAAALLCAPLFGQDRGSADLEPCVEIGIADLKPLGVSGVQDLLKRCIGVAESGGVTLPPEVVARLVEVDDQLLPLTFRLYLPASWDRIGDPPRLVCAIDTAVPLPLEDWIGLVPPARPGGVALGRNSSFIKQLERPGGGHRVLAGEGWEAVAEQIALFSGDELPGASRSFSRLLRRVGRSPIRAVVDVAGFAPPEVVRAMRAAGGPNASTFALSVGRAGGATNIDVLWGGRPGNGMVGSLLDRSAGAASDLHKRLPFVPGVAIQARFGAKFADSLRRTGIARRVPDPKLRELLATTLDSWQGEIGFFQPEPDAEYDPEPWAPTSTLISPELVFLVRVDPEGAEELLDSVARSFRIQRAGRHSTLRIDERHNSVHAAHRDGLLVLCRTEDKKRSAELLEGILAPAKGVQRTRRIDPELDGPVQAWVSPVAAKRMAQHLDDEAQADPREDLGYRLGQTMAVSLIRDGYGMSLTWDSAGVRFRFRF